MDPLPEKRGWRAFPRFPLIDDGLTGGADQARESSLADVEVSAQRFELMYCPRVLGQWFDGIRFYAAASSPRRSRRTWAGLR